MVYFGLLLIIAMGIVYMIAAIKLFKNKIIKSIIIAADIIDIIWLLPTYINYEDAYTSLRSDKFQLISEAKSQIAIPALIFIVLFFVVLIAFLKKSTKSAQAKNTQQQSSDSAKKHEQYKRQLLINKNNTLGKTRDAIFAELKKSLSNEEFECAQNAYNEFANASTMYFSSMLANIDALQSNTAALKTMKIDPYVAGGIGGVATGVAASMRNQAIDQARKESSQLLTQTTVSKESAESILEDKIKAFMVYVDKVPKAYKIYSEALSAEMAKSTQKQLEKSYAKEIEEKKLTYIFVGVCVVIIVVILMVAVAG